MKPITQHTKACGATVRGYARHARGWYETGTCTAYVQCVWRPGASCPAPPEYVQQARLVRVAHTSGRTCVSTDEGQRTEAHGVRVLLGLLGLTHCLHSTAVRKEVKHPSPFTVLVLGQGIESSYDRPAELAPSARRSAAAARRWPPSPQGSAARPSRAPRRLELWWWARRHHHQTCREES